VPLLARYVPITEHRINKLTIVVSNGSIHFAYEGKPNRPVKEFQARVTHRQLGGGGSDKVQNCDVDIEYESGNYHITINTVPVTHRNADVDFDNVTVITLDEPGWLQINNTSALGKVALCKQLGDQFVKFMDMDVNGDPASQKLRIQPGQYELRYRKNPKVPIYDETKVRFAIRPNETTELQLKQ
jgi:hypothetical protein